MHLYYAEQEKDKYTVDSSSISPSTMRDEYGLWDTFMKLAKISSMGWIVGCSIALGVVGGYFIDKWLDTAPYLTILGLLLGIISGTISVYRLLRGFLGRN